MLLISTSLQVYILFLCPKPFLLHHPGLAKEQANNPICCSSFRLEPNSFANNVSIPSKRMEEYSWMFMYKETLYIDFNFTTCSFPWNKCLIFVFFWSCWIIIIWRFNVTQMIHNCGLMVDSYKVATLFIS